MALVGKFYTKSGCFRWYFIVFFNGNTVVDITFYTQVSLLSRNFINFAPKFIIIDYYG